MKIFKEAKDKGKAPSKVKGKREKIKKEMQKGKYFHFWVEAENVYP